MALPCRGFRGGCKFSTDFHRTRLPGPVRTRSGRVDKPHFKARALQAATNLALENKREILS
jgi:hypothetical protein